MSYEIHIPNWHPTPLNKMLNSHWAASRRMKLADAQMIAVYANKASVPKALGKRSVGLIISYAKGQRSCDPDAYYKSTLDALVKTGYLKNDSAAWVSFEQPEFRRSEMSTTIILKDVA